MYDHRSALHLRRAVRRDVALVLASVAVCVAPAAIWEAHAAPSTASITATMVGTALYSRLAMGRGRTAIQVVLAGFLLAAVGVLPRMIVVVIGAGFGASELVARVAPQRMNFVKIGIMVALFTCIAAATGVGAVAPVSWTQAGLTAGATVLGALLGPGLMLAFAPVAEWAFGHVTPMTLTEWLSYDHPLLRDLAVTAPGTFQHSVNVGLLADAAAREVGANPLRARVGGLYHDVGKLRAPGYFVENQAGDNPHDGLDPGASAQIVRGHVAEGVALVRAHHMGHVVADFVREHHGQGVMALFRQKAVERGGSFDERDFRYNGPSPGSRETGIVMIADQLEATARAEPPADLPQCEAIAARTIARIVASGELARAGLSAEDLAGIRRALSRSLFAMYHRRLTYPATPASPAQTKPALVARLFRGQAG